MGVVENVIRNIKDIAGGARDVVTGTPTSPYTRDRRRKQKEFEKLRDSPRETKDTGFTPVKDPSGRVRYVSPSARGGTSSRRTISPQESLSLQKDGVISPQVEGQTAERITQQSLRKKQLQPTRETLERFKPKEEDKQRTFRQRLKEFWERPRTYQERTKKYRDDSKISKLDERISKLLTPEGVKKPFDFAAEQTLKAGDVAAKVTEKVLVKTTPLTSENIIFTAKAPIKRETAKELISSAYMFAAFEPVIRTGTAQQMESQYIYDYRKGRYVKKIELEKLQKLSELKGALRDSTQEEVRAFVKRQSDSIMNNPSLTKGEKLTRIKNLVEFVRESRTGADYVVVGKTIQPKQATELVKVKPSTSMAEDVITGTSGVELRGITAPGSVSTQLSPQLVGETNWITTDQDFNPLVSTSPLTEQDVRTKQESQTKQKLKSATTTLTRQDLDVAQDLMTRQDVRTKQESKPKFVFPPVLRTAQTLRAPARSSGGVRLKPKTPTKTKFFLPGIPKEEKKPALNLLRQLGYLAQVKEKGKWKNVKKEAYTKSQASKLAKWAADKTIAASARIKETSKSPSAKVLNLMVNDNKFRDFKRRGGSVIPLKDEWIEKRKFRLDTPKEVQTLQQFKRSSEFKGLFGSNTGSKKKKRGGSYNWFS